MKMQPRETPGAIGSSAPDGDGEFPEGVSAGRTAGEKRKLVLGLALGAVAGTGLSLALPGVGPGVGVGVGSGVGLLVGLMISPK